MRLPVACSFLRATVIPCRISIDFCTILHSSRRPFRDRRVCKRRLAREYVLESCVGFRPGAEADATVWVALEFSHDDPSPNTTTSPLEECLDRGFAIGSAGAVLHTSVYYVLVNRIQLISLT